jgi:multicomponent Na+:H+ antiporter subunit D
MTLGLFAIAGILVYQIKSHTIADFRACFRTMPLTMAALVVFALAIIGVPPTGGFFSKWYLIQGAVIAKNWLFVIALLTSSLINVVLFFKIFEIGYGFTESHAHGEEKTAMNEAPFSMLVPTLIVAIGIILVGIYNQLIVTRLIQFAVPEL